MKCRLGIIGGSGLYELDILKKSEWVSIHTPWGKPSDDILSCEIGGKHIYFLPRHNRLHNISPSNINYLANIYALKSLGVTDIISVSAVGSLKEDLVPGKFVIVDQFIDRTYLRKKTFFDDDFVAHVPMGHPTSSNLMNICEKSLMESDIDYQKGGTYVTMEGPQFSTLAESLLYRSWQADVIGMTNMPEAKLAREAEIRYSSIAMVTDFDCWHPDHDNVDVSMIVQTLQNNAENAKKMINNIIQFYSDDVIINDSIHNILDTSLITNIKNVKATTLKKLDHIISRVIKSNEN